MTSYPKVCVGTKRGKNLGVVYAPNGEQIGRVFRASQRAAGTGSRRERRPFWTAVAVVEMATPEGVIRVEWGGSLGTRHATRQSAVNAVYEFSRAYPPEFLRADARDRAKGAPEWSGLYRTPLTTRRDRLAWGLRHALSDWTARFKRERWDVCAIPARRYCAGAKWVAA